MSWAHYLLQANLYLIVFFIFYKLFLEGETYFKLNRSYLIAAGVFSLIIPFIRLEWFFRQPVTQKISAGVGQLTILISGGGNETTQEYINWGNIVVFIYITGALFFLGRFMLQLLSIKKIFNRFNPGSAFTFFGKKSIDPNLPGQDTINAHEHIHIQQLHTADILFFEIIGIVTWFNPVIYFYKHAVKNIHEYLADDAAAAYIGDKEAYAMLLLSKAFGVNPSAITNSFFNKSLIKKRIIMLHKEKSRKTAILKYGLFVPLFSAMLILSSATLRRNEDILNVTKQIPLNSPMQAFKEVLINESTPKPSATDTVTKELNKPQIQHGYATVQAEPDLKNSDLRSVEISRDTIADDIHNFSELDVVPSFPGGMRKFYAYVAKNIKYPTEAVQNNVEGRVILSFTVEKNGELTNIQVDRKAGSGLDEEAVRVLQASPFWTPGKMNDELVRVKYNIPISFVLNTEPAPVKKDPVIEKMTVTASTMQGIASVQVDGKPIKDDVLFIVDGQKSSQAVLKKINSNKIESISVIKNQTAVLLYGAEAKNGVVLVKMKKNTDDNQDSWLK
ncbi:M56 family metallopeptidase [Pedobacter duraquae]|uniref:TonB family protein n=1 Tax=Pedobacter duraquae TaxID=425511 RepID=A0A4R6IH09_9SPHI|nr:M56 family metallopeptidase [Pedobacter duraquae]TDO21492.1 TonB family protein [Pedobacter duraquae]